VKNIVIHTSFSEPNGFTTEGDYWKTTATNGAGLVADIYKDPEKRVATFAHVTGIKFEDVPTDARVATEKLKRIQARDTTIKAADKVAASMKALKFECRNLVVWVSEVDLEGNQVLSVYVQAAWAVVLYHVATVKVTPDAFDVTENATVARAVLRPFYTDLNNLAGDLQKAADIVKNSENKPKAGNTP
jgi:hypothetical protein